MEFSGFNVYPIGNAELEIVDGELKVSNVLESGFDGILIDTKGLLEYTINFGDLSSIPDRNGVLKISTLAKNKLNQELSPGQGRRVEPEGGVEKHNKRIHKESKFARENKNLPFSFRKPPKPLGASIVLKCENCGTYINGTTATVGVVCKGCGKFSKVIEVEE